MARDKIETASRHSTSLGCFKLAVRSAPHSWWQKVNSNVASVASTDTESASLYALESHYTASVLGKEIEIELLNDTDEGIGVMPSTPVGASLDAQTLQAKGFTQSIWRSATCGVNKAMQLVRDVANWTLVSLRFNIFSLVD